MKGMLFKPVLIPEIIELRKTQTRRLSGLKKINEHPHWYESVKLILNADKKGYPVFAFKKKEHWITGDFATKVDYAKPRYKLNEIVYVKEAWCPNSKLLSNRNKNLSMECHPVYYKLDNDKANLSWKSPMYMPEWASRIKIKIINIKAERVQDISQEDAHAEGVANTLNGHPDPHDIMEFRAIWDTINSEPYSWHDNPWAFAYEFKIQEIK
jgi:hypothetical protein